MFTTLRKQVLHNCSGISLKYFVQSLSNKYSMSQAQAKVQSLELNGVVLNAVLTGSSYISACMHEILTDGEGICLNYLLHTLSDPEWPHSGAWVVASPSSQPVPARHREGGAQWALSSCSQLNVPTSSTSISPRSGSSSLDVEPSGPTDEWSLARHITRTLLDPD